jgi:hypothetical protein
MSNLGLRFVGWCILGPKGLFLHGLGEEYFGGAKWVSIGDEPTFYVEKEGAEDMIAQLVLLDASLMDRLQIQEAYRLADGQYVIKAQVNRTAWLIVMAPDGPDQWDIEKWTYWTGGGWTERNWKAKAYSTEGEADTVAFGMTMHDHSLVNKIHVWRFEQPVGDFAGIRPWRRVDG